MLKSYAGCLLIIQFLGLPLRQLARKHASDHRPPLFGRPDAQSATNYSSSIVHDPQAKTFAFDPLNWQAGPIIADEKLHLMPVPPQTDDHFCGPTMLHRIVEGFLSQPKKMVGNCLVAHDHILSFDTARDAK